MLVTRWLAAAPAAWASLLEQDPSATAAHRPGLWHAFTSTMPGLESALVVVEEDGALLGGAPVVFERRAGFTWLHALPMLLPAAPIARAGRHAEVDAAIARALEEVTRSRGVVGGEWSLYRVGAPAVAPESLEVLGGETRWFEAAVVDLSDGLDAAWRRVDRKQRQAMQQSRARAMTFVEDPGALEAAYALHLAQGRHWQNHRALPLECSRRLLAGVGCQACPPRMSNPKPPSRRAQRRNCPRLP